MIAVLGSYFGGAKFDLKEIAPIAHEAHVPILVDAAADYLIVPIPYIALGADLVAYSAGRIIRGAAKRWAADRPARPGSRLGQQLAPSRLWTRPEGE
jgi:hypothetical protein